MVKVPSRTELLRDQFVIQLFGSLIDEYKIKDSDLKEVAARARRLIPKYDRQQSLEEATRRVLFSLLSEVDSAFDDVKRAPSKLDSARNSVRKAVHALIRGYQDSVSGIMEINIRTAEEAVRSEFVQWMSINASNSSSVRNGSKGECSAHSSPVS